VNEKSPITQERLDYEERKKGRIFRICERGGRIAEEKDKKSSKPTHLLERALKMQEQDNAKGPGDRSAFPAAKEAHTSHKP
jgi:hypothetical protein